jgi:hypothetical protein
LLAEDPGALAAPADWPASPEPGPSLEESVLLDEPVPAPVLEEPVAPPSSWSTPLSSGPRLKSPASLPGAAASEDPGSAAQTCETCGSTGPVSSRARKGMT